VFSIFLFLSIAAANTWKLRVIYPDSEEKVFSVHSEEFHIKGTTGFTCSISKSTFSEQNGFKMDMRSLNCKIGKSFTLVNTGCSSKDNGFQKGNSVMFSVINENKPWIFDLSCS